MIVTDSCPTDEQLASLLAGQLAPDLEDAALAHLSSCESCQRKSEAIAESHSFSADLLGQLAQSPPLTSAALRHALDEAKAVVSLSEHEETLVEENWLPCLDPPSVPGAPRRIGAYEVLGLLGRGGMGAVLKVRDPALNRLDAIKVLLPQIAFHPTARQRFLREARAAAAISHENVVTIFAVEEIRGFPCLVMEYLQGPTLQDLLQTHKRFAIDEVVRIGIEVSRGLAAAHLRGIVHRDIKPSNILIKSDDGRIKITDFGLAHVADDLQLTQSGMVSGTPPYMSPEQAQGLPVDWRTDLFSLGCLLYAMCAGQSPFQGRSTVDTLRRVCDCRPTPLSQLNSEVPDVIVAIIDRLLAKNASERGPSAAETAVALDAYRPTLRDSNVAHRSAKIAVTSSEVRPVEPPSIAVLPFTNLSSDPENEYFGDGLAEDLINSLTRVPGLAVAARTSAFQFTGRTHDVREVGQRLNVRTILEGSVRKSGHRIRISAQLVDVRTGFELWSQRYDRELEDIFAVQDDIAQTIVEELRLQLTSVNAHGLVKRQTDNVDAYSRYLRGRFHWNKREPVALKRAIDFYDQALALDPDYAEALAGRADCDILLANYALMDQQQAMASAKQCAMRALELDDSLAEAHKVMGFVLACSEHDWRLAEQHFQRAIAIDPLSASSRMAFALSLLLPLGRFEEAHYQAARAAELDPVTPMIVAAPAVVHTYRRQFDEARAVFREALELDPDNPVVNLWSCALWMEAGEFDRGLSAVEFAKPFALMAEETAGVLHARAGHQGEAHARLSKLRAQVDAGRREATLSVARIYAALDETDEALVWLDRAVQGRVVATVLLKVDPRYDRLRGDPRFHRLLASLGLS